MSTGNATGSTPENIAYQKACREQRYAKRNVLQLQTLIRELSLDSSQTASVLKDEFYKAVADYRRASQRVIAVCVTEEQEDESIDMDMEVQRANMECNTKLREILQPVDQSPRQGQSRDSSLFNTSSNDFSDVKLPKIVLPKFSGEPEDWVNFSNLFIVMVHNTKLTNVQKLFFLKQCCEEGKANSIVKDLDLTDENYDEGWALMQKRFENARIIVGNHFKQLFSLPKMQNEYQVRTLLDKCSKTIRSLKSLGEPTVSSLLCYVVSSCLDLETRKQWELSLTESGQYPKYEVLEEFLYQRALMVDSVNACHNLNINDKNTKSKNVNFNKNDSKPDFKQKASTSNPPSNKAKSFSTVVEGVCMLCEKVHKIEDCAEFKSKTPEERYVILKDKNMCYGCLGSGHSIKRCKNAKCTLCDKRHHTLLHRNIVESSKPDVPVQAEAKCMQSANVFGSNITLPSAVVYLQVKHQNVPIRILLDSTSQVNLMTEGLVKRFKLLTYNVNMCVSGISGKTPSNYASKVKIQSRYNDFNINVEAFVVPHIATVESVTNFSIIKWPAEISSLPFAETIQKLGGMIDMLIGAEFYEALVLEDQIKLSQYPYLRNSQFGWFISGKHNLNNDAMLSGVCCLTLDETVQRFWELDTVPDSECLTDEQLECEKHFENTYTRDENGKFVVRLPFKQSSEKLGESFPNALRQLIRSERTRSERCSELYIKFMQEYLQLGHMELAKRMLSPDKCYYMPHHAVMKRSTTTPLRVVFNASRKTTSDISVNDMLMAGPVLQCDLFTMLLRLRKHVVVFTADISKMYRCISVHEDDRDFQRILWRDSSEEKVQHYRMTTVTYGTVPGSYLSTKCLQKLADLEREKYPLAYSPVKNDFYMDDLITGSSNIDVAIEMRKQIHDMLKTASLELRKYMSNSDKLLETIPIELQETLSENHDLCSGQIIDILGLQWVPKLDILKIHVDMPVCLPKYTKRDLLSESLIIFDPLGILNPCTVVVKLLLQQMWIRKIGWKELVPKDLLNTYLKYRSQVSTFENIEIPRGIWMSNTMLVELHGFCDSSEAAYGACIYMRSISVEGKIDVNLLCSKSRIAPIKMITIPRLELCGALLLARLVKKVIHAVEFNEENIRLYSDSTVTLSWLAKEPINWKTFVANRVAKTTEIVPFEKWMYVRTNVNPADLLTRGIMPEELQDNNLWFHGPEFLSSSMDTNFSFEPDELALVEQKKENPIVLAIKIQVDDEFMLRFSSLDKLVNVMARCLHVAKAFKRQSSPYSKVISIKEKRSALMRLIQIVQEKYYKNEIDCISNGKEVKNKSPLRCLRPELVDGILRVSGRLSNATLSYDAKHPIILPKRSHLTNLLIEYYHRINMHAPVGVLQVLLRCRYWIVQGRRAIRQVVHKCTQCFRYAAQPAQQLMANLPIRRVQQNNPFYICGVDFTGAIITKSSPLRGRATYKSYIALFVCFSTRAVHLELVDSLSTESFLAALKCFISRRGKPKVIHSDNATNFVGTDSHLRELYEFLRKDETQDEIIKELKKEEIEWSFNPPAAPHFGGIWESNIKSMKKILVKVIGEDIFTYAEMHVLLTQVEALMNSRPLCQITHGLTEDDILTPGHFLIGRPLKALPELKEEEEPVLNYVKRWGHIQYIKNIIWSRWRNEYLLELQRRNKWSAKISNVKVDDIVLLMESNVPAGEWQLARVTEIFPGNDGLIRAVHIKTSKGEYRRPIAKIAVLPFCVDNDDATINK